MTKKTKLIYLMGTGRSGTTALATILGNHEDVLTLGEINQFYGEIEEKAQDTQYWKEIYLKLNINENFKKIDQFIYKKERHWNVIRYGMGFMPDDLSSYHLYSDKCLMAVTKVTDRKYYVDSSKYVARALLLSNNPNIEIKIINVIRDPRGLIWSFKKKVQTQNHPLLSIVYYWLISSLSVLATKRLLKKGSSITIRYEDLMDQPQAAFKKIAEHVGINLDPIINNITTGAPFNVPDIIGGNRLKHKPQIIIQPDVSWKTGMPKSQRFIYYFLTLPFNLLYKYKI